MDRRKFLKMMGCGVVTAAVAPQLLGQTSESTDLDKTASYARAKPTSIGGNVSKVSWDDIVNRPGVYPPGL